MSQSPSGPSLLPPGTTIGKCEAVELVGRGGMGSVYRCRHRTLQIDVAVKLMSFSSAGSDGDRKSLIQRFFREARAAARIRHENVISVLDVDEQDGRYYMVMELVVGGRSARKLLEDGPVRPGEVARIGRDTARALSAAHALGIVHRDIKPENILLTLDNQVKIGDFGIAAVAHEGGGEGEEAPRLTQTGQVVGTPHYMSPEQVNGSAVDGRADIYSLGATIYHLVTGTFPFRGQSAFQVCMKHVMDPLDPPRTRLDTVPEAIEDLILRMMAKRPDERPQSALAVAEALDKIYRASEDGALRLFASSATFAGAPGVIVRPAGTGTPPPAGVLVATPPPATPVSTPLSSTPLLPLDPDEEVGSFTLRDVKVPKSEAELQAYRASDAEVVAYREEGPVPPRLDDAAAAAMAAAASSWKSAAPQAPRVSLSAAPAAAIGSGSAHGLSPLSNSQFPVPSSPFPVTHVPGSGSHAGAIPRTSGEAHVPGTSSTPIPAKLPGASPPVRGRGRKLARAAFFLGVLVAAGYVGYRDGMHERWLKPAFARLGIPWPDLDRLLGTILPPRTPTEPPADAATLAYRRGLAALGAKDPAAALAAFLEATRAPLPPDAPAAAAERVADAHAQAALLLEAAGRWSEAYAQADRIVAMRAQGKPAATALEVIGRIGDFVPRPPVDVQPRTFAPCRVPGADRAFLGGDVDGDGRTDAAVWGPSGGLLLLTKEASEGGAAFGLMEAAEGEGEVDRDGKGGPDRILAVDPLPSGLWRPIRASPALFGAAAAAGAGEPRHLDLVDLEGDSLPDLAFSTPGAAAIHLRMRRSAGGGDVERLALEGPLAALAAGRAAQGPRQLLAALGGGTLLAWQLSGATLARARVAAGIAAPPGGPPVLAVGDVTGDGLGDIVATAPGDPARPALALWRADGSGGFVRDRADLPIDRAPAWIALADLDLNGSADLVVLDLPPAGDRGAPPVVRTWLARADGPLPFRPGASAALPGIGAIAALAVGDADGDQKPDLAVYDAREATAGLAILYGDGRGGLR